MHLIEDHAKTAKLPIRFAASKCAEKDDLMQEGRIGLFKAIMNYDSSRDSSFKTFANLCIKRQLINAVKNSNRQKHMPLNNYVSLNGTNDENSNDDTFSNIETVLNKSVEDPLDTITKKEYMNRSINKLNITIILDPYILYIQ